ILGRVARQGHAEVVLGGGGEAVPAVTQVVEVGGAREDLAFGLLLRSKALAHLLLQPDRQAYLLQLPEELVRGRDTQDGGEEPGPHIVAEQGGPTLATRRVPEEVTADELLRERRATMREMQPKPVAVP